MAVLGCRATSDRGQPAVGPQRGYGAPGAPPQAPAPSGSTPVGPAAGPFGILLPAGFQFPAIPQGALGSIPWPFNLPPPSTWVPTGASPLPPVAPNSPADWSAWEQQVLSLVNQRRAQGATCGSQPFGPAAPLEGNSALHVAARRHSEDMGRRGFFDHTNPEGAGPAERCQAAGFPTSYVGENIAAGQDSPEHVMQSWMASPGHCGNIMNPNYRWIGVGYASVGGTQFTHYWTQDFGGG